MIQKLDHDIAFKTSLMHQKMFMQNIYAFTGCNTISAIHMFGKTSGLAKLKDSSKLRNIADQFYLEDMSVEDIRNATIHFFELKHSASSTLQQIRKQKYMTWWQLIVRKLIQPFFHHLLVQHFIMGFNFIIGFKFGNN